MPRPTLRVARPTDDIDALRGFYLDGLGFEELGSFEDHEGFDGLMIGWRDAPWHLEFTRRRGHSVGRAPTADNLLVLYLPDAEDWRGAVERMKAAGHDPVAPCNPYWALKGATFEDPDGYRVVLQNASWQA